jgi:hypothetical protein
MPYRKESRKLVKDGLSLALVFVVFIKAFPEGAAHEILNGIFVGMAVLIAVLYRNITIDTIMGRGEYGRAQRMALSLAILWAALNLRTLQSILYRSSDQQPWILNLPITPLVTYLVIIAGYLQLTSPNFKQNTARRMHGQSKTTVAVAATLGFITAAGMIWLQRNSILQ